MFVAWRDLRFARGRFALIATVVALVTLLVGFLTGLTGGLASQNVSAVLSLPADRIVLTQPTGGGEATFGESALTTQQAKQWRDRDGVASAEPLGITQGRAAAGDRSAAVAVFGLDPGVALGSDRAAPSRDGRVVLSAEAADQLDLAAGATLSVSGLELVVDRVVDTSWYSHTPVVWVTLPDWRQAAHQPRGDDTVTALLVNGELDKAGYQAADATIGTVSASPLSSLTALSSFRSEIGSLALIVVLLLGISALVVGAFFTVWTMQRQGDIAVLKALGASTKALVQDALGQALVVLVVGVSAGVAVVAGAGWAAQGVLPFVLSPLTTLVPGALMVLVGLAGAAFAVRSVTSADPLTALGSIQ